MIFWNTNNLIMPKDFQIALGSCFYGYFSFSQTSSCNHYFKHGKLFLIYHTLILGARTRWPSPILAGHLSMNGFHLLFFKIRVHNKIFHFQMLKYFNRHAFWIYGIVLAQRSLKSILSATYRLNFEL